jgi:PncC family amidohydrolase
MGLYRAYLEVRYNILILVDPLEVQLGQVLLTRHWSIAVAESCTGGLLSHLITNVPGASSYFLGGIIAYANQIKINQLHVNPDTLQKFGAVSRETVLEMASGVRNIFAADIGLSTSGIAGPSGGTIDKPVGTTWIGLSALNENQAFHFVFSGTRWEIKNQAAQMALKLMVDFLIS